MGMFDYITGNIKCPNCGEIFEAEEQIKWADCLLIRYKVGDEIEVEDGEYDYGSMFRPWMYSRCPSCSENIRFKTIVDGGVIKDLVSTGVLTDEEYENFISHFKIVEDDE